MRVETVPGKKPVRVKARRYPAAQRAFLNKYVDKLVAMNFFKPNPDAQWQAAPLLVPKKGSKARFRLAIDLRPVNAATVKQAWPMPHIDSELQDFAGSTSYAVLDFVSGFWQLPLHPDSYDKGGVVTPNGTYTSMRTLPGLTNATAYFQSTIEPLFHILRHQLKAWLDDFILHATSESGLLDGLDKCSSICQAKGLYLSARKCEFFCTTVKWCGRIISKDGFTMDPSRVDGLRDMQLPKTVDEVCEFVHCCRWMSIAIPDFAKRVAPLVALLEEAYTKTGRRTKRSIRGMLLQSLSWGASHVQAFHELQDTLRNALEMAHPKPDHVVCVFTDASEYYWSGVVSQTRPSELSKPIEEQQHEPLAFLGAAFKGAEKNWSMYEKEGFAIFQVFDKMDYLFFGDNPTHVFTDHRNLLFVFAPLAFEPALGRHIVAKVQRWALFLSRFDYLIEHIDGARNVFADILTRWCRGYRKEPENKLRTVCSLITRAEQIVPSPSDFAWPTIGAYRESQERSKSPRTHLSLDTADKLWKKRGLIWVPEDDPEMQLKVMVVSHCGLCGHRGQESSESIVRENFYWRTLKDDMATFVRKCLHCLLTRSGEMVPRPLGQALHASRVNEVIHMDYLYMGTSTGKEKYLLIIRDDLSGYIWLWPADGPTSEVVSEALTMWIAVFGGFDWIVSDQGTHFKNRLIEQLTKEFRISHHFTTAYCPWANGSVERVCREVLRASRALLSEWKLSPRQWPTVSECLSSVLNQAPSKRLGLRDPNKPGVFRTPLEVFTGHLPSRPLLRSFPSDGSEQVNIESEARARQLVEIDKLHEALSGMHRTVKETISSTRRKQIEKHNNITQVTTESFQIGDFVLVRCPSKRGHKLRFHWRGPRRVVQTKSAWVYQVEDLTRGKREAVHVRRMILYRADMDGIEVDSALFKAAKHSEEVVENARALRDIREENGSIAIQIEWDGLPDDVDLTCEPLESVKEDLPGMLHDFLCTARQRELKRKTLRLCSFE